MAIFQDLKTLMNKIIEWENGLTDFYDVAEIALKKKESKEILVLLRQNHVNNLKIIKNTRIEDYGKDEWIRYAPDYKLKELIPIGKIKRESSPKEIITHILDYEEKIKGFYFSVSEIIITRDGKELFDSLVNFKVRQILELKALLEYHR